MGIAYYNEIDKYCCQWLENLMHAGHIPVGVVDDRPIQEVRAYDLEPYTACHFFAGLGGWAHALRLAEWDEDTPVWTGSCPCQPFSVAGQRRGTADERHLWPEFYRLIAECNPPVVFGEQVASKDGRLWLSGVRSDLETVGYAVGAADLCAAGVGSPTIRQRLYWMGYSQCNGEIRAGGTQHEFDATSSHGRLDNTTPNRRQHDTPLRRSYGTGIRSGESGKQPSTGVLPSGLADRSSERLAQRTGDGRVQREAVGAHERKAAISSGLDGGLALTGSQRERRRLRRPAEGAGEDAVGASGGSGRSGSTIPLDDPTDSRQSGIRLGGSSSPPRDEARLQESSGRGTSSLGFWSDYSLLPCLDGKSRRIEPGTFPLAHGIPARMGKLRAYGNAIVPPLAAEFVRAAKEILPDSEIVLDFIGEYRL